ncbi:AraC family transcriptional regulator ligand-binding domain-containing protein [Bosea sp. Root483D1]|uniref:AraC family transcriptional regulator ligand-binding domain-containing protein n=1 Tax=Bosea sp. Root483D1 TaxID=1736544 RepID=UPI0023790ADF|nr:AraC family transcriptional regulator ligand-binding domain-containing protein [Bosea sp. Root483D1]
MAEIPVISSHILHGLPAFLRREVGERALLRANRAAGFDLELTEGRNCFIPHAAVIGFVKAAARAAGEPNLGLLMAPMMNAANYGCFGRYVLGADTLRQSIERAIAALCYHSTNDRMSVAVILATRRTIATSSPGWSHGLRHDRRRGRRRSDQRPPAVFAPRLAATAHRT